MDRNEIGKTAYRILEKNYFPKDCDETLLMYIPEYWNDYTGTWTKIHKCIKDKKPQYFFDLAASKTSKWSPQQASSRPSYPNDFIFGANSANGKSPH